MGNGSDATKQTAQLVLLDSDFAVLRDVISEGRRVINNLTKSAGVFFIKTIYSVPSECSVSPVEHGFSVHPDSNYTHCRCD